MIILDLFCGTKSIANTFEDRGHKVYTVDWDDKFNPSLVADIGTLTANDIIDLCGGVPDVIWSSPDCTSYSVAAISKHRRKDENGNLVPISDYAKKCDETNRHLIKLIKELNPKYFFIENPRAGFRKMDFIQDIPRYTVTYCFAPETEIVTDNGTFKIGDMCNKTVNVIDGNGNFVPTMIRNYGKSNLMKLTLTRHGVKKIIYATPNHQWFASYNKKGLVETKDLKRGYRLDYQSANRFKYAVINEYVARGFVFGDGWIVHNKPHAFSMFVDDKQEMIKYFDGFGGKIWDDNKNGLSIKKIYSLPREWKTDMPSLSCSKDELYSWLIGYFAADGSIAKDSKQVTISSAKYENLKFVEEVCNILGIGHYEINESWRKGFNDELTPLYQLTFMRSDLTTTFFLRSKHRNIFDVSKTPKHQARRWTVESVEYTDRYEDVFCCEVSTTQSFVLNGGILTHNCKYGDKRMKPTDIFTNHPNPDFIPPCKNGDKCHESAPRGSRTGTQGLKNNVEKARIPKKLCEHIVDICENNISSDGI